MGDPGPLAGGPGGTRPSEAGLVSGSSDSDVPGALTARFLFPQPEPLTQPGPPSPEWLGHLGGRDFLESDNPAKVHSDSHSETARSHKEDWLASAEARQAARDAQAQA